MTKFTQKALSKTGEFVKDAVKGIVGWLGEILKINSKWALILFGLLWFYDNKVDLSLVQDYLNRGGTEFKEDEVSRVEVNCKDNTAVTHIKGQQPKFYVGVKSFKASKFEDGRVEARIKNKGFGLEPGLVVTAGDGLRLGADLEYAYWKQWGLLGGFTYPVSSRSLDKLRGHLGLSYDFRNRWFSSTSLWAGLDSNKTPVVGFRTKIGGGS